ncbi:MAG: metalloprotease family protein [Chloroflexi bacterium]|nr:metalloprotease family protein [Chloroflexota bacterium]
MERKREGMVLSWTFALFAMPGIVLHELAHLIFCWLFGARVHKVVFFRMGNPAGYVVHTVPARFSGHFAIVMGPFVVNSLVAFAIFRTVSYGGLSLTADNLTNLGVAAIPIVALWWGMAIGLHAFPSNGDAKSLWQGANARLRKGNLLVAAAYPFVALIYAANFMRSAHVDFAYALLLFVAASVW